MATNRVNLMTREQPGSENFADLLTKHLPEPKMLALLALCGYEFREGRAEGAPELAKDAVAKRVVQAQ